MSLRYMEIAESQHRWQNPLDEAQFALLGEICGIKDDMWVLDLACGKGAMLVQWAQRYGVTGVGVDLSEEFITAAKNHAYLMDVGDRINFDQGDAADYPQEHHQFDLVSCLGASWIGGGLAGTLQLMQPALKAGGTLLIGEPFWYEEPPGDVYSAMDLSPEVFTTLPGTLDRFEAQGLELVDMVLANEAGWDRYEAGHWRAVRQYAEENPDADGLEDLLAWVDKERRTYINYGRRYLGWGVFVLRPKLDREAMRQPAKPVDTSAGLSAQEADRPVGVELDGQILWVRLNDGRVIGTPLGWYPWLSQASPAQQQAIELTQTSVYWPDLGQRLEVRALLRGKGRF